MTFHRFAFVIFCWCLAVSLAWGDDLNRRFQFLQNDYARLLRSPQERARRDNWERIISLFEKFSQEFPDHEKAPPALFMAGRASQGLYRYSKYI